MRSYAKLLIYPKKTSSTARDQLMQIVDWLYSQTEMAIDIPKQGCSEKIKLYSLKFNNNGGWALSENIENIFSWQKDTNHTEEWSVWIISSTNDKWHDYGEIDKTAEYNYNYIVPKEQEKSIFGFVSHDSTLADGKKNATYGNLLDNIAFKEYYYAKVEVAMNDNHGKAQIIVNENNDFIHDEKDDESLKSGWALIGSSFTVHVTEAEDNNHRPFVGAYINGTFVPKEKWTPVGETGEYTYTFDNVKSAIKVNIIFAAKQIYYDSRCPYEYQYDLDNSETGPEVPMSSGGLEVYTSHAPTGLDGWEFVGWKYINPAGGVTIFNAVHTVKLIKKSEDDTSPTFSVDDSKDASKTVSGIPYNEGITFLAEWKYRQRVIAKTFDKTANQYLESTVGGRVDINVSYGTDEVKTNNPESGEAFGKELYASSDETYITVSAYRNTGYAFNGWYDKDGKLVSKNTSYAYKVPDGETVELHALFEPYGLNLTIDCDVFGDSEDVTKYFKVNCTFTNLRANQLYIVSGLVANTEHIVINGERVYNPTTIRADENGNETAAIYMKHGVSGTFVFLPENCTYTIQADGVSSEGFSVRGEVTSESLKEETIENLIFYKASQTAIIDDGKHYDGIDDGKDKITITKNSSYTFQATTKYTPSIYEGLNASLCCYDSNGIATEFAANTRILMIDLTDGQYPNYYSYTVNGSTSAIALTEFIELGTANDKFTLPTGSMVTENLVFVVDYVGTGDSAAGGKVALVYDNVNSEIKNIINPKRKTADIGEDTTGITATAGNSGKAASVGPFVIDVGITESSPAVNTTYKEDGDSEYAVQLSVDGGTLPDGSYAVIDGIKYYSNNGYIKITSLITGNYKLNVYSPIPIELSDGKVKFNVTLLEEISASPAIPVEISQEVNFTCVEVAIDADVSDKVLNPGNVSGFDIKLKHKNLDEVKLTVTKKGSGEALISIVNVPCPKDNNSVTVTPPNGFPDVSGETYIFTFVGYLDGVAVTEDTCCVVGGYVIK